MLRIKEIKRFIKAVVTYREDCKRNPDPAVRIFNAINYQPKKYTREIQDNTSHWLYRFVKENHIPFTETNDVSFFGVHGHPLAIRLNKSKHKVFFTVENVHAEISPWLRYEHQYLEDNAIDLSLGFDYKDQDGYLRFPFWVTTFCEPTDTLDIIREKCDRINKTQRENRKRFAAFICRVDYFGDRAKFADMLEAVGKVAYPSGFRHNDDSLKDVYHDNKGEYLRDFVFNLCPENTNAEGYVTEKLFDAIESGCIPVYWGSNNCPEPEIVNQNSIIFLSLIDDNHDAISLIERLWKDEKYREAFISQPVFQDKAPERIFAYLSELKLKLEQIARNE